MEHCASTTGCRGASCATDDVPWSLSAKVVMPSKKDSTPCWRTTMSLCCEYRAGRQRSGCRGRRTAPDLVSGRNAARRVVSVWHTRGHVWLRDISGDGSCTPSEGSGAHELDDFFRHKHHFTARAEVKTAERNGGGRTFFRRPFAVFLRLE